MENKNLPSIIASSVDPKKIGMTVTAVILGLASTIVLVTNFFGLPLGTVEIEEFAAQAGLATSGLLFCYGVIRKVVVFIVGKLQKK